MECRKIVTIKSFYVENSTYIFVNNSSWVHNSINGINMQRGITLFFKKPIIKVRVMYDLLQNHTHLPIGFWCPRSSAPKRAEIKAVLGPFTIGNMHFYSWCHLYFEQKWQIKIWNFKYDSADMYTFMHWINVS